MLERRPRGLMLSIVVGSVAALGLAASIQALFGLSALYTGRVAALFTAAAVLIAVFAARHVGSRGFGIANHVTMLRMVLIAILVGLIFEPARSPTAWLVVAIATVVLLLDGLDGKLARRFACASRFGARFDMEADTVLILGLSALAWQWDKAGAWILTAGLLRHGFVLAGRLLPWLRAALPASRRRQTICIVQAAALLACISPLFRVPVSGVAAFAGLALLVGSFAVDVAWLARNRPPSSRAASY